MNRAPGWVFGVGALIWLAIVGAVVVSLLDEDVDDRDLEAPALEGPPCSTLTLGVHSTLGYETITERRETTVAAISEELEPQLVRDTLLWNRVEPSPGERDWASPDGAIEPLRAAGIEPLMVVLGSPPWANGAAAGEEGAQFHVPTEREALAVWLDRYSDFLAEAAKRYQGVVRRWEIWNEPNLVHFWKPRPDPRLFGVVYERLRETILQVDPDAEVAVGGLTSLTLATPPEIPGREFLRRLLLTGVPVDNVAIHPYTTENHSPAEHVPGENNFDDIAAIQAQLADTDVGLWVTEWGWSSVAIGEALQAIYVDRSLTMLESRFPDVELATYFTDHDRPPEFFQGLLHADLGAKPAAASFERHASAAAARCQKTTPAEE